MLGSSWWKLRLARLGKSGLRRPLDAREFASCRCSWTVAYLKAHRGS